MIKRAIPLSVLIAIALASPPAHPEQERAPNPNKIELLPEQLDTVTAGVVLACGSTSPTSFQCEPVPPAMCAAAPTPTPGAPLGITAVCPR
jgi:hypothetical protein